jgi:hypothetical protein
VSRDSSSAASSGGGGSFASSSSSTDVAAPVSLQGVAKATAALCDAAAVDADKWWLCGCPMIVVPLLKVGLIMAEWLHRVIVAVWVSADRYPHQFLYSIMHDAGAASRGAQHISWEKCVTRDLKDLQVPTNMHDLKGVCELRGSWRCMLYRSTTPMQLVCLVGDPMPCSSALQPLAAACPDAAAAQMGLLPRAMPD